MSNYEILWNLHLAVTVLSTLVMIFSALTRRDKQLLGAAALVLVSANFGPMNALTTGRGLGASWFLIALVGLVLILRYRLDIGRILFAIPTRTDALLLFFVVYLFAASPFAAYDPTTALRRGIAFLLVFIVGWRIFGEVFRQQPESVRSSLYVMLYAAGAWNIVYCVAILVLIGPATIRYEGMGGAVFALGGRIVPRLQIPILHGTGLSEGAAAGILLVIHWLRAVPGMRRLLFICLLPPVALILLWGGGRGAIFSVWATGIALSIIGFVAAKKGAKVRSALVSLLIGVLPIVLWPVVEPVLMRGARVQSLLDALMISRLDTAMRTLRFFESQLLWGAGAGTLAVHAAPRLGLAVESFFFQVLIEFGVIAGAVYALAWLSISFAILRTDFHYMRQDQPAAWLPSAGIIFTWAGILAGYGFGIFTGSLALTLATGAAATIDWTRIQSASVEEGARLSAQHSRTAGVIVPGQTSMQRR